jgi:hypothetical protein
VIDKALVKGYVQQLKEAAAVIGGASFSDIESMIREQLAADLKASAPQGAYTYCYVSDVFPGFVIYREEVSQPSGPERMSGYYKRSWTYLDGKVVLGEAKSEVEKAWVEVNRECLEAARGALEITEAPPGSSVDPPPPQVQREAVEVPETKPEGSVDLIETVVGLGGKLGQKLLLETIDGAPVLKDAVIIEPGVSINGKNYPVEVLRRDGPVVFADVPIYATQHQERDVRTAVGVVRKPHYVEGIGLKGDLHGFKAEAALFEKVVEMHEALGPQMVGLSINTPGTCQPGTTVIGGRPALTVASLLRWKKTSVELVTYPSAGGRLTECVEEGRELKEKLKQLTEADVASMTPALARLMTEGLTDEEIREATPLAEAVIAKAKEQDAPSNVPPTAPATTPETTTPAATSLTEADVDSRVQQGIAQHLCGVLLKTALKECEDLGSIAQELLAAKFGGRVFQETELDTEVKRLRDQVGKATPTMPNVPGSGGNVQVIQEATDVAKLRLEGFFKQGDMRDAKGHLVQRYQSFRWEILPQLAGINAHDTTQCREAMGQMTWQGDLHGRRVEMMREAVTVAGFGEIYADVFYKVLIDAAKHPKWSSWQIWTQTVPFQDITNKKHFIRVGGYGNFDQVGPSGTYQYMTSPTDEEVSFKPDKYGGLEKVEIEAIWADNVRLISRIPTALGNAWGRTVHDGVYSQFQTAAGNGPTMGYDATALYNAGRTSGTNIVDSALGRSSFLTARAQMMKRKEKDSLKPLQVEPRYCLFASPDLDETAYELFQVDVRDTTNKDSTMPSFVQRNNIIPIPVRWPTASAQRCDLIADPSDIVGALVGFLNGRFEPEILVQDAPNSGSRFTADIITYKAWGTFGFVFEDDRAFQRIQNN